MSESEKALPPGRTIAVTVAGVLLLLPAALSAYAAYGFAANSYLQREFADALGPSIAPYGFLLPVGVCAVVALIFGSAGVATIRRWRGWRILAGTTSWGLIGMFVFSLPGLFGSLIGPTNLVLLAFAAFAVFALVAKRRERKPDLRAVFG